MQGSHRIEALLYRDGDAAAALPWARWLAADYRRLARRLAADQAPLYTPPCVWHGLVEVATEVAKKKISGEEETWSDQSVLIFHNNLEVKTKNNKKAVVAWWLAGRGGPW